MIGSSTSITGRDLSAAVGLKWGPTIAADAGDVRSILAYRSFSMNVISPGPASPTGRAEWIETLPSPTRRPRTRAASCSTVATTRDFLSSMKGADGNQDQYGRPLRWAIGPLQDRTGSRSRRIVIQEAEAHKASRSPVLLSATRGGFHQSAGSKPPRDESRHWVHACNSVVMAGGVKTPARAPVSFSLIG